MSSLKKAEEGFWVFAAALWLAAACASPATERIEDPPPVRVVPDEPVPVAPAPQKAVLRVSVTGIRGGQGTIRLALFSSEEGFPSKHSQALHTRVLPASPGQVGATFEGLAPGTYAVAVIHDANDNGELDTNWVGMPKEGYGASNDAPARFGPPRFEDARIAFVPPVGSITMRVRYPD